MTASIKPVPFHKTGVPASFWPNETEAATSAGQGARRPCRADYDGGKERKKESNATRPPACLLAGHFQTKRHWK